MDDVERWQKVVNQSNKWRRDNNTNGEDTLSFGEYFDYTYRRDIKHIGFTLSRYKFVSKLFRYRSSINVLELGCNEAVGAEVLRQNLSLSHYVGIDLDEKSIAWNKEHFPENFTFIVGNFFDEKILIPGRYKSDVVISLDVIEHIENSREDDYCKVIAENLMAEGVAVIGTPNITMEPYASEASKLGHINLYSQRRLYDLLKKYFENVFIFGMNDEVVHTGFDPMCCYIFALCTGNRMG